MGEAEFSQAFTDAEPLKKYVGNNAMQLRRASAIKQKGYYKNPDFKRTATVLISIIVLQAVSIGTKFKTNQTKELIVFILFKNQQTKEIEPQTSSSWKLL